MSDKEEGILSDKIQQDEIRSKARSLTWKASDMIHDILSDEKNPKFSEKKKQISSILDDLEREIMKIAPKIKPEEDGSKNGEVALSNKMTEEETLEYLLTLTVEEAASTAPWSSVDKGKLPKSAFLWVEGDGKLKSQWHLPYKDTAGNVNLGALRAIAAAIAGARTGKPMSIPADVRKKITALLKRYKIGQFAKAKTASLQVVVPDERS